MESKKRSKREREEREDEMGIRKGPWTAEEDSILVNYISTQGEGRWNFVAKSAGLKRTGKSCRLRWVNYLRPDVRRGNITLQEQILIIDLHSRWGNRWSKIAQHLPGRTDNEIKNYWRTRVMKQAKYLNCDVNTQPFRDAMRYVWLPRLLERIRPPIYPPPPSPLPTHHCLSPISDFLFTRPDTSAENGSAVGFTNQHQALYLEQGNTSAINTHTFGHALDGFWNDHNIWFLPQHL